MQLNINFEELEECGRPEDETARLWGQVEINGVPFHINAEAVVQRDGLQVFVGKESHSYVPEIQDIIDGAGRTIEWQGRHYLVAITPYRP